MTKFGITQSLPSVAFPPSYLTYVNKTKDYPYLHASEESG
jgi:hypothetical protein